MLKVIPFLFVGLVVASTNPGWRDNTEYTYLVRGRTLASLHEVSNQYSGILLQAKLTVHTVSDEELFCKISDAKYSQIHSHLPEGWNSRIQDSELSWKPLEISEKPFKMVVNHGVVKDVIVNSEIANWEANVIRSIVSQFQLDTKAHNVIPSPVNTLPDMTTNTANFKTMEDTVTGNTETLYDIHLLPEYVLQNQPWLAPKYEENSNEQLIEIVKSKNYSNSADRPSYHFGLFNMEFVEPTSNNMGDFYTRSSVSRIVVTGNLNSYTIQNSFTVNKQIMSPTLTDKQKGSVVSMLNVTLTEMKKTPQKPQPITRPVSLGNLVYRYDEPYGSNKVRPLNQNGDEKQELISSEESLLNMGRFRRYSDITHKLYNDLIYSSIQERYPQKQDESQVQNPPKSPLLPFTVGYRGNSIKNDPSFDIEKTIKKLAREIGVEMQEPEKIPSHDTLAKFTIMASLCRVMSFEEMKNIAQELYTTEQTGLKYGAWVAYRDAVAETGTGPALLTIRHMIESKMVKGQEACALVSTIAVSSRQPTLEYVREFYELVNSKQTTEQEDLHRVALLSFTDLLRKVYVNKQQSHNKYPVHSFGSFRTEEGKMFVTKTVIPELQQKLHEAITKADSNKVLTYTRAIGNIGHHQILSVFEPFLEGQHQVSQFQRFWMLICLDKLAKTDGVRARSVMYKIYQNLGENPEIRAAAVFQIMRTGPPSNLLQRMAEFTHIDNSRMVNAAVKSSIEHAAKLEGKEFQNLKNAAKTALPLLNKQQYKLHEAGNMINSYVFEEISTMFKNTIQWVGDENMDLPKMLKIALRLNNGGMRQQLAIVQGSVSNLLELTNVMYEQTEEYKKAQEESVNGQKNQWSSKNIARLLNLRADEREALEGVFNMELGPMRNLITFNNRTIEKLPLLLREIEGQLEGGKDVHMTKFLNRDEIAFSFPTEMGFPFLYTYDKPTLLHIRGRVSANSSPKISTGKLIRMPESVEGQAEIETIITTKVCGKMSFITPFDHEQYSAGFNKIVHVNLPLKGKMEINLKEKQVKSEIEPLVKNKEIKILHASSSPFTSVHNILNTEPLSQTYKLIRQRSQRVINQILGKETTGIALQVKINHEVDQGDSLLQVIQRIQREGCIIPKGNIQQGAMDVVYLPQESSTNKLSMHFGMQQKYKSQSNDDKHDLSHLYNAPSQSIARQQDFERKAGSNMRNAEISAYDASFEFQGKQTLKYTFTAATAKSNVDPTSRILFYFKKHSDGGDQKSYHVAMSTKMHIPNRNELNLEDALKHEPSGNAQVYIAFGNEYESSSKIKAEVHLSRNQETKQIITEDPLYQVCKEEQKQGLQHLPACANLTRIANRMDVIHVKLQHHNVNEQVVQWSRTIMDLVRLHWSPMMEVDQKSNGKQDEPEMELRINPNYRSVNVSIKGDHMMKIRDVVLPLGVILGEQKPSCVVEHSVINSFNNRSYPVTLKQSWITVLQYVPPRARSQNIQQEQNKHGVNVEQQLEKQIENYVVLARQHQGKTQEVRITLNTPKTNGETIEIHMKPSPTKSPKAKVLVNGQEVKVNNEESHEIKHGLVEIYALNNGEIKMVVRNAFELVFDGARVKVTPLSNKFRSALRGICGNFNENADKDRLTSDNCVSRSVSQMVESYTVQEGKQRTNQQDTRCSKVKVLYANVVSDLDAGRDSKYNMQLENSPRLCSIHQTRYIEEADQICFTRRPYPVCKCKQQGTLRKEVSVHCVQKSQVSDMWKQQIEKGLSPSFENKQETKTMHLDVPQVCTQ